MDLLLLLLFVYEGGGGGVLGCCCVFGSCLFVLGVHHFLQLRDVRFSYFVNFCFGLGIFVFLHKL